MDFLTRVDTPWKMNGWNLQPSPFFTRKMMAKIEPIFMGVARGKLSKCFFPPEFF